MVLLRSVRHLIYRFRSRKLPNLNILTGNQPKTFTRLESICDSTNWPHQHEWILEDNTMKKMWVYGPYTTAALRFGRILNILLPKISDVTNVVIVVSTAVTVFGIGIVEAFMLSEVMSWKFILLYSYEQMFPSNVWEVKPAVSLIFFIEFHTHTPLFCVI
jgi:hypothetical protein